jgi:hypothetical protein
VVVHLVVEKEEEVPLVVELVVVQGHLRLALDLVMEEEVTMVVVLPRHTEPAALLLLE